MARRKPNLEDFVDAIIARDEGMSYPGVLDAFGITPNRFYRAGKRDISDYIGHTSGDTKRQLIDITNNISRTRELFNMGEQFIRKQYDNLMSGHLSRFCDGTSIHPRNIESLVYYALIFHNPRLASTDRTGVIECVKNLPTNLNRYLYSIGLGGLMVAFEKENKNSPFAVLEIFDNAYQRKTGDKSLFDLNQKNHLHIWGDNFKAPRSYWQNPINVEGAIYHILTENNPKLASIERAEVIEGVKNLPTNLTRYLHSIGLGGLMINASGKENKNSPLAVLEIFDKVYQRKTGDKSLFDLNQEKHLHRWGDNSNASQNYWQNSANVEEAIYHTLTENNPQLASIERREVIEAIKNLPAIGRYMRSIKLGGLIVTAFKKEKSDSPLAVLEIFDNAYQRKTGDKSLFDITQENYISFDERNRLIR